MRVFGWAADNAGCGYYRMGLPLTELGRHGHDTQVSTIRTGFENTADVIVGQRVCNDGPASWWRQVGALPTGERPALVYEVDDDLLGIHPENDMAYDYFADSKRRDNVVAAMAASDAITVSTEYLAGVIRERLAEVGCPPVYVLENAVDESLLAAVRPWTPGPVLGWAGSGTHRPDFLEAGPQLARFLKRNPGILWHSIGTDYLPQDIPSRMHTRWTEGVENYYRTVDFTVGVAPLAPLEFNRSKSAIKALEYGAMGIPIVASDYGPYSQYVVHGVTGYLVRQPHEWGRYLRLLFERPAERARMGVMARRHASTSTIQSQYKNWERTYTEVLNAVQ